MNRNTVTVGNFNTPLTLMGRCSRQKMNKETVVLNDTLDQINLIDIFRAFHPKAAEYTFFSSEHGTLSKIDHMLGHKTSLNEFQKTEIMSSIFSDHESMKLEMNCQKKNLKNTQIYGS